MQKGTSASLKLPTLEGKPKVAELKDPLTEGLEGSRGEVIAMKWLTERNIEFEMQVPVLGGRQVRGGRVLDIVISYGDMPLVIRVQSERYHAGSSEIEGDDIMEKVMLLGLGYEVVDVWEERLLTDADYVMRNAVAGIEVGR